MLTWPGVYTHAKFNTQFYIYIYILFNLCRAPPGRGVARHISQAGPNSKKMSSELGYNPVGPGVAQVPSKEYVKRERVLWLKWIRGDTEESGDLARGCRRREIIFQRWGAGFSRKTFWQCFRQACVRMFSSFNVFFWIPQTAWPHWKGAAFLFLILAKKCFFGDVHYHVSFACAACTKSASFASAAFFLESFA